MMDPDGEVEIRVRPSGKGFAAEIEGIDLSGTLSDAMIARIRAIWLEHLVLVFRRQTLTDEQIVAFAKRFGEPHVVDLAEYDRTGLLPEIDVISNIIVDGKPIGALSSGEAYWHTDMSIYEVPASATINYGAEIPPSGGNTRFANTYAAYETLPDHLRERIVGRFSTHSAGGYGLADGDQAGPTATHPIVCTHPETGRKALYIGPRAWATIPGLSDAEAKELSGEIWDHILQPEFLWEQEWETGDLIMWDNRCLMHGRGSFDPQNRRMLRRVTVKGDRPA